jgi:hypothetical protein
MIVLFSRSFFHRENLGVSAQRQAFFIELIEEVITVNSIFVSADREESRRAFEVASLII